MKAGLQAALTVLPFVVVLLLLLLQFELLIAGFVGVGLSLLIGGITLERASESMIEVIPNILGNVPLIIDAALAYVFMQIGTYRACVVFLQRVVKIKPVYISILCVCVVGFMTFFSGHPTSSVLLVTPLVLIVCGFVPEIIAALSFVATMSVLISPQSVETQMMKTVSGMPVLTSSSLMFAALMFVIALAVACIFFFLFRTKKPVGRTTVDLRFSQMESLVLLKHIVPLFFLLCCIIGQPFINHLVGFSVVTPLSYMIGTLTLTYLCNRMSANDVAQIVSDGAGSLFPRLFQVALFFGCINVIGEAGGFGFVIGIFQSIPASFVLFAAICVTLLIAIPGAVYVSFVLELMLPFVARLGFSPLEIFVVSISAAIGSQLSVASMTLQTLALYFDRPVFDIIKANQAWITFSVVLLSLIVIIFGPSFSG
jgi:hypothetical protein